MCSFVNDEINESWEDKSNKSKKSDSPSENITSEPEAQEIGDLIELDKKDRS